MEVKMRGTFLVWLLIIFLLCSCGTNPQISEQVKEVPEAISREFTQAEEAPPPIPKAEILDFNCVKESYSDKLFCFGLVKNTGDVAAYVEVILTTRDTEGNLALRESGYTSISTLPAGMESPFTIYSVPLENCDRCEFSVSPIALDWEVPYTHFKIISEKISKQDYSNGYEIIGEIENTGDKDSSYPAISAAIFDDTGKIIGTGSSFPDIEPLPAGQVSTFSILIMDIAEGNFKTYKLYPVVGSAE